jgi:hypothetical protein
MKCLRSLERWDRGFESHSRNGCLCVYTVCIVLCVGSGLATGWSTVQGVLPTVYRLRNWKHGSRATDRCRSYYGQYLRLERSVVVRGAYALVSTEVSTFGENKFIVLIACTFSVLVISCAGTRGIDEGLSVEAVTKDGNSLSRSFNPLVHHRSSITMHDWVLIQGWLLSIHGKKCVCR